MIKNIENRLEKIFWSRVAIICIFGLIFLMLYLYYFGLYRFSIVLPQQEVRLSAAIEHRYMTHKSIVLDTFDKEGKCSNSINFYTLEAARHGVIQNFEKETCGLKTTSPWFIDLNHAWPFGRGVVNVLFASYVKGYHGHFKYGFDNSSSKLSFEDRKLLIQYSTSGLNDGSSINFWFQTQGDYGRINNYIHVDAVPIIDSDLLEHEIDISNSSKYICIGSIYRRAPTYGCDLSPHQALKDVRINFGFIRMTKSADPQGRPNAEFVLHKFEIR
jgi:hypothetical protein